MPLLIDVNALAMRTIKVYVLNLLTYCSIWKAGSIAMEVVTFIVESGRSSDENFGVFQEVSICIASLSLVAVVTLLVLTHLLTHRFSINDPNFIPMMHQVFRKSGGPFVLLVLDVLASVALFVVDVMEYADCRSESTDVCHSSIFFTTAAMAGLVADIIIVFMFLHVGQITPSNASIVAFLGSSKEDDSLLERQRTNQGKEHVPPTRHDVARKVRNVIIAQRAVEQSVQPAVEQSVQPAVEQSVQPADGMMSEDDDASLEQSVQPAERMVPSAGEAVDASLEQSVQPHAGIVLLAGTAVDNSLKVSVQSRRMPLRKFKVRAVRDFVMYLAAGLFLFRLVSLIGAALVFDVEDRRRKTPAFASQRDLNIASLALGACSCALVLGVVIGTSISTKKSSWGSAFSEHIFGRSAPVVLLAINVFFEAANLGLSSYCSHKCEDSTSSFCRSASFNLATSIASFFAGILLASIFGLSASAQNDDRLAVPLVVMGEHPQLYTDDAFEEKVFKEHPDEALLTLLHKKAPKRVPRWTRRSLLLHVTYRMRALVKLEDKVIVAKLMTKHDVSHAGAGGIRE